MLNQVVIAGRLTFDPEINEVKNGRKITTITIAVPRTYKNMEGVYETDFIKVELFQDIANKVTEYCKKGDIVGVRGRIKTTNIDNKNVMEIVAEKVSFLSTNKTNSKGDIDNNEVL